MPVVLAAAPGLRNPVSDLRDAKRGTGLASGAYAFLLAVRPMGIVAGWGRFPLVGAPGDVGAAVEERIGFIEDWRAGARRDVGG